MGPKRQQPGTDDAATNDDAAAIIMNTMQGLATGQSGHVVIDTTQLRDPAEHGALDPTGNLIVHPVKFWQGFTQQEITYFCVRNGFYCIPTTELVGWLKERIAGREETAIEIGAGSGVLATALGILATDNRMQEWPVMARAYRDLGQAPVRYGANVLKMDAAVAVKKHKPAVVVGAWITHKFRPYEDWRKGNQFGVEEEKLIPKVQTYIHVGHTRVHEAKPALEFPHGEYEAPWLVSRAMSTGRNYICWWGE